MPEMDASGSAVAYAIGVPLVLALILIETVYSSVKGKQLYNRPDTLGTLGLLLGNIAVNGAIKASVLALSLYLYQFRIFDINSTLPMWAVWFLTFVAIDFVFYWWHRLSHRVRFLWAIHMNHHCSEELNFVVAFRQPWLAPIFKIPFFATLPLVGFDPTITVVAGVHHGSNPQYIDKNYGNIFIIWDRLFGTFEPEREDVIYGLRTNIKTQNPFAITAYDWQALFRSMKNADSMRTMLGHFFGPPDWQPQNQKLANAETQGT